MSHVVAYFKLNYRHLTKMLIPGVEVFKKKNLSFRGCSVMWLLKKKKTNTKSSNTQKLIYSEEYSAFTES